MEKGSNNPISCNRQKCEANEHKSLENLFASILIYTGRAKHFYVLFFFSEICVDCGKGLRRSENEIHIFLPQTAIDVPMHTYTM